MSLSPTILSSLPQGIGILVACLCLNTIAHAEPSPSQASENSWEKPRNLSAFDSLLHHSPFSVPTAEESSPLADRYALTGIVTISGEEEVFVFDRTDQSREMLTHTPNPKNMSLVTLVREGTGVPQKATIRVGSETGTISYLEAAPQTATPPVAENTVPGHPTRPPLPPLPQLPGNSSAKPPGISSQAHRVIRRSTVAMPPPPAQAPNP